MPSASYFQGRSPNMGRVYCEVIWNLEIMTLTLNILSGPLLRNFTLQLLHIFRADQSYRVPVYSKDFFFDVLTFILEIMTFTLKILSLSLKQCHILEYSRQELKNICPHHLRDEKSPPPHHTTP